MKATIVAINRQIGALVVETEERKCAVLETYGRLNADIGDEMEGDWSEPGSKLINNVTRGDQLRITLQDNNMSRNEAVGRMTVL